MYLIPEKILPTDVMIKAYKNIGTYIIRIYTLAKILFYPIHVMYKIASLEQTGNVLKCRLNMCLETQWNICVGFGRNFL